MFTHFTPAVGEQAAMWVFKLSCKLATCYAGGQTLEKRQIAENRLVEKKYTFISFDYL